MFRPAAQRTDEPLRDISRAEVAFRSLLIFVQIGAAYLLAEQVSPFFYQQF